ncbi:MAG: hypothetical protein O2970_11815 [Proteobacteria bacterium]|nr:hypothetical protein [Pseudomonadota bacterium]
MNKTLSKLFTDENSDEGARKKQITLFIVSVIIFIGGFTGIFLLAFQEEEKIPFSLEDNKIKISDVTKAAKAEDRWLEIAEKKLQDVDKFEDSLKRLQDEIKKLNDKVILLQSKNEELIDHKSIVDGYYQEMASLKQQIQQLRNDKGRTSRNDSNLPLQQPQIILPNQVKDTPASTKSPSLPFGSSSNTQATSNGSSILDVSFGLEGSKGDFEYFNINEYLPAGSYVSAVVISGVDASVGISSQQDPRPVLFRIDGKAKSALHNNDEIEVGVDGCIVTGAASGDLSSEKVFVRLLKMTCANGTDTVIETNVKGYASAVGKAGVRGNVVSREGDLVIKSFFAGLAGGVGSGVSQRLTTPATIIGGVATTETTTKDILGMGLGKGVESSADRVAEYLIERAEQYQPVITIPAGIEVELVFHEGVYLDGRKKEILNAKK